MSAIKLFMATVLLVAVGVNARHIPGEAALYGFDEDHYPEDADQEFLYLQPGYLASARVRRQAQGSLTLHGDGSAGVAAKVPLGNTDKNRLSAIGQVGIDKNHNLGSKGVGLALDNVNGHGLTVMKESIPGFGSKLTGAGSATLFKNDNHNVGANAFVTRNMPDIPNMPNYNTVGGGVDYTFKNKIGAALDMSHTPFLDRKEYSAMGNLNVFHSPTSSVDFSAGVRKFETPFVRSGWEPNFLFKLSKSF